MMATEHMHCRHCGTATLAQAPMGCEDEGYDWVEDAYHVHEDEVSCRWASPSFNQKDHAYAGVCYDDRCLESAITRPDGAEVYPVLRWVRELSDNVEVPA